MVTPEQVQRARRIPIVSLLPADHKLVKKGPNSWMALCTFHEETTPSMSLVKYPDGCWGYRCFGCGAKGDPIKYIQEQEGKDFQDSVRHLLQEAKTAPVRRQAVAEYDYFDRDGVLAYQVLRYEPKDFRVRRPSEQGWRWCLDGLQRHLYRLQKLNLPENRDKPIYYVEGEKDVETLERHGLVGTTHNGGANSFRPDLLDEIEGVRRIVVVPDRDEPGMQLMRKVFGEARNRKHSVGFLLLPRHKDVTEWFEAGETLEDLLKEVK